MSRAVYGQMAIQVAFVSTSVPRRCGIATFTSDLMAATRAADPSLIARVAAIDEPNVVRLYGHDVRWRIQQGDAASYRAAAAAINESKVDVVNVQHEFGLYGVWRADGTESVYEDHLRPFLEELRKPVMTTLHSVPPEPSTSMRAAVQSIVGLSQDVVVMAAAAVDLLRSDYGLRTQPKVIPHGMPAIEPHGRNRFKAKLGLEGRTIVSTFGLVDPRKGLEFMVQAMPAIVEKHPDALYLIAGQTHPELLRTQGEQYRNHLRATVGRLDLANHVYFLDHYLAQREIVDLLLATDVYVTPYLDPRQITSGTLAYALGAGKAIVSTRYLHAVEALADGRGMLVDFRDSNQIASSVNSILADPSRKGTLEHMAYAYAKDMTWPKLGRTWVDLMDGLARVGVGGQPPHSTPATPGRQLGARLPENPILTRASMSPSRPELEVVSVFNAAAARVGDEVVLLLRVAERPISVTVAPPGAQMLDLTGPEVRLRPLPVGIPGKDLVGMCFLDTREEPARLIVAYLPRDLSGLDLSDPRTIRFHSKTGGSGAAYDIRDYLTQLSHLRVARSTDGVHFNVDPEPAVVPANSFEEYGCEDPRATLIDGVWHITYVSVARIGITTSLLTTTDFRSFERHGVMFLPDHKDVAIFPERIGGRYVALTRPMPQSFGRVLGIWIAYSDDLIEWGGHTPLALPRWSCWDEVRTGAGAVPFRVPEGWLELYHGVDRNMRYAMGALLLDGDDPSRVIARSPEPILAPTEPYERTGLFNDTVFSCGHVPLDPDGDRIRLYYGAADSCLAAADFSVKEIVEQLTPC
jgi:predicted GH43/DUF377 family glycosyl hydrolase/glycosyltransferase involved in cell wall biosynthesis